MTKENKKKCIVAFTSEAYSDLYHLPQKVFEEVVDLLEQLEDNMFLGKALYDRPNSKLGECRKLYVANRTYRIVYEIIENRTKIKYIEKIDDKLNIAKVLAVGPREGCKVYKNAHDRLKKMKKIQD